MMPHVVFAYEFQRFGTDLKVVHSVMQHIIDKIAAQKTGKNRCNPVPLIENDTCNESKESKAGGGER